MSNSTRKEPGAGLFALRAIASRILMVLAVAPLLLTACGGGSSDSTDSAPAPTLAALSPASATGGGAAFTLTVTGAGFVSSSTVQWNGANRVTTFVSATQLTASITATDIATAGTLPVTVVTPAPGGGTSTARIFTVGNPAPTITSLSQVSASAGDAGFSLTVNGTGFVPGSAVQWNGTNRATTFVSTTQLTAAIAAADIATGAAVPVTVLSPAPGGGSSAAVTFTISNPSPTLASLSQVSAIAGAAGFTLTAEGSGFVPGSIVRWNGSNRVTTFVSATQLTATIAAGDIATGGTGAVTVLTPGPGGGTSTAVTFTVINPSPTISGLSPVSGIATGAAFTLTVNGGGFVPGSIVRWNGSNRTTTFVSATQLTATIVAGDIATGGTALVTVLTPAPGGGTSASVSFAINNPVPTIAFLSPGVAIAGAAGFTLTVSGSGFVPGSVVRWNGSNRTTTFVSATQLAATIAAGDIATAGTAPVTVFTPAPGGGTSAAVSFAINNPVPAISSLAPASTGAEGEAFTLTVNGTGFVAGSTVRWNGSSRVTTFVSATRLTAAITAADIPTPGTAPVTVLTPGPGGGTSAAVTFTINNPAPKITSLAPDSASPGDAGFTLTVTGTGFVTGSTVRWNDSDRATTFISATQLTAAITAADLATAGTVPVTVFAPGPVGGGASAPVNFTVNNPAPTLTSLSQVSAIAGEASFTLTVNGSGFAAGSVVQWNGAARATTLISATQLTALILTADIATARTAPVTVRTPAPGGGTSAAINFTVTNAAPTVSSLTPAAATTGAAAFTLTVTGTGFVPGSIVQWNGTNRVTTFTSTTQLSATIAAGDIALAGTVPVVVVAPAPGGGTSAAVNFSINNPAPAMTTLSPTAATAGAVGFTLTVNGTGFVAGSTVQWNGTNRITTFVSATRLTATIATADIATAGTATVAVRTPAPGGGTSAAVNFAVNNPAPTVSSLSPTSAGVEGASFTLTVNGTGFMAGSTVRWNGTDRVTTYVSPTRLTAAIAAGDLATAGTVPVTVLNPTPGGGTSGAGTFTVSNPAPTIASLSPAVIAAGNADFTLTVNGAGFVAGSTVRWSGTNRVTTFVSATQLTAAITAADIATGANVSVTVLTPTPGGGTSAASTFAVTNSTATISALSPAVATAGGAAFTLTVTGSGFVSGASVRWNGSSRTTTFVSATQLTAAITAADIATAGAGTVTVLTPTPGGGTSAGLTFTINSPAPTIAGLSPAVATAGGAGFTLTVTGTGFAAGSTVQWNGSNRTTTFVSATQLTATIATADIAAAGTSPVTVLTPAPGGGTSSAVDFTVNNPAPTISTLAPASTSAEGAAFTLTVNGTGFVPGSTVQWNGTSRVTTFVSATRLTAAIAAGDILTEGTVPVTVLTATPGGGTSTAATFTVSAANTPSATISSLSPAVASAGGTAFTLTVSGTGFVSGSTVQWNGSSRVTTFVSGTELTAAITAADITAAGTALVTVLAPAPGNDTSAAVTFTINNPAPAITTLSPTAANAGAAGFTLTVNGSGFVAGSVVRWNGIPVATTFVNTTRLTATIAAGDLATVGTVPVTVLTPTPGGGTSAAANFSVNNPAPTISSLSPTSVVVEGAAFTLTVNGSGFVAGSTVRWNGVPLTTTYVSATRLTAPIAASDITAVGTVPVTVLTPTPGGGTSSASNFSVNNPAPTIAALSPSSLTAGDADFTLTVTGTGFVAGSTVRWNGSNRTTTFVSATQLTATITAADIATGASVSVTVLSPTPGGGTSAASTFTVKNVAPAVSGLSPAVATAGGAAFTLTVTGSGFIAGSTVRWNGSNRTTTFVSSTQLTAAITAADIATSGTGSVPVTVFTATPGGGTSAAVSFTINNGVPVISALSPAAATAGGAAFTLTVTGTGFASGATVRWNGAPLATTFVSTTQLTATVAAGDIAADGTVPVTVLTPAPGGGTSAAVDFTISNAAPTISSVTPAASAGGPAFALTVNGTGFVPGSTVQWNGSSRDTTFVSATRLIAAIAAADIATEGTVPVTVSTPAPGGGTSAAILFTVGPGVAAPAVPVITLVSATIYKNQPLNVSGASADPASLPLTYTWDFGDGGAAVGATASHVYATTGSYTLRLTATNSASKSSSATMTITVLEPLTPEVADNVFTPYCFGTKCSAADASTYTGSGIGIWRYHNSTASPATVNFRINGVQAGQKITLIFSNGQAITAPSVPFAGTLLTPTINSFADGQFPQFNQAGQRAMADGDAHTEIVERNLALTRQLALDAPASLRSARTGAAAAPAIQAAPPPPLGTARVWNENYPGSTASYATTVTYTCPLSTGRNVVFWLDPNVTGADSDLAVIENSFCGASGGYERLVSLLGDVWGTAADIYSNLIRDVPAAPLDVNIVILRVPPSTGWGGYFYGVNNFLKSSYARSNEALAFFVNGTDLEKAGQYYASLLLHEATHMVNFYQRGVARSLSHDTWLEESSAMMSEDIISPVVNQNYSVAPLRAAYYLASGGAVSYINWPTLSGNHYDLGSGFGAFLNRRYGTAIYKQLIASTGCAPGASSLSCMNTLIGQNGGLGFADEYARFGASIFGLLGTSGLPFGFGFPATTTDSYDLSAIDMAYYSSIRPPNAATLGAGFTATTHTYVGDTLSTAGSYERTNVVVPAGTTLIVVVK